MANLARNASQRLEGRNAARPETPKQFEARACEGQAEGLVEGGVGLSLHQHPFLLMLYVKVGVRSPVVQRDRGHVAVPADGRVRAWAVNG